MTKTFGFLLLLLLFLTPYVSLVNQARGSITDNTWESKAPMPTPRAGLGVAVVDGKIFAIGGTTEVNIIGGSHSGGLTGVNEEYDPSTDTWTTKSPMPTPRAFFAIAVYQNLIYCIGGNNGPSSTNEVYHPATDTWETKAPMPTPRYFLQANVVDGKIYCVGGADSSGRNSAVNEVYDPATDTWATKSALPIATSMYESAVSNNKIYVIGGFNGVTYNSNKVPNQIYDPENDNWTLGAYAPEGVGLGAAVATSGVMSPQRIYIFGNGNQVYDPENNSWTIGEGIPVANLISFGAANVNDRIYVIGGEIETYPFPMSDVTNDVASGICEQYTPFGYGTPDPNYVLEFVPPQISFVSPLNQTYNDSTVQIDFTVNKNVSLISYSLDGQLNVTIAGNTTIANIFNGSHNLSIYANDTYGNVGTQTINFTVEKPMENLGNVVTIVVVAVLVAIACLGVGLFLIMRHRKQIKRL